MALTKMPEKSNPILDALQIISAGADSFSGQRVDTKNTQTQTTSGISPEAMAAMLKSLLEGTQGLAATASGEKAAGLYGSSTNELLINDLMTRTAAQVAMNGPKSTTTSDAGSRVVPARIGGDTVGQALGMLGLLQAGSSLFNVGKDATLGATAGSNGLGAVANKGINYISDMFGSTAEYGDVNLGTGASSSAAGAADSTGLSSSFAGTEGSAATGGFLNTAGDFITGSGNGTAGQLGNTAGYAYAAYKGFNDIKDDNLGGAVGAGIGAAFGGPAGAFLGEKLGTAADTYILDPINQEIIQPVGDWFDDNVTQRVGDMFGGSIGKVVGNVASKAKNAGSGVVKGVKNVGSAIGDVFGW